MARDAPSFGRWRGGPARYPRVPIETAPHMKEESGAGGRAGASSGMGVWGPCEVSCVPIETDPRGRRSGSRGAFSRRRSDRGVRLHLAALARGAPLTPALTRKGRGSRTPSGVRCAGEGHAACADPAGAWGLRPHREKNPRVGGWAPSGAQRALLRDGGVGGAAPPQTGRGAGPASPTRARVADGAPVGHREARSARGGGGA